LKKKGYWLVFLVLTLCLLTSPAMAQKHYLNMGSTSSTSGVYAWCVATANVINKSQNDIQVTVIESGAALDNLRKIKAGVFDFALCVDLPSAFQMVREWTLFKRKSGRMSGGFLHATSLLTVCTFERTRVSLPLKN